MKFKPKARVLCLAAVIAAGMAHAQISGDVVKIGFVTDMTGSLSDTDGPGGVEAARMAIADFGGMVNGKKIELLSADHQNKADIAATIAREWIDRQGLDMLIGGTNSSAALAMSKIAADKKKPLFVIAAGSSRMTNEDCSPFNVHYAYDTVSTAKVMGTEIVKAGGDTWYFLTADYAFGKSLEADSSKVVTALGAKVLGASRFPLSASDFFFFPGASPGIKSKNIGTCHLGRRHEKRHQGGQRVRGHQADDPRGPDFIYSRYSCAHTCADKRYVPDRKLVLGSKRRVAQVGPTIF